MATSSHRQFEPLDILDPSRDTLGEAPPLPAPTRNQCIRTKRHFWVPPITRQYGNGRWLLLPLR